MLNPQMIRLGVFEDFEFRAIFDFLESKNLLGEKIQKIMVSADNWEEEKCDFYFLSQSSVHIVLSEMIRQSTGVRNLGSSDLIVREKDKLWPRNFLGEVLPKLIVSQSPNLSTQAAAYVAGGGTWGIVSIGALLSMGFNTIFWVVDNKEVAEEEIKLLRKNFFSINVKLLNSEELVLQAHNGSVIINTIPVEFDPKIITDISYYNYLMANSLAVELVVEPIDKIHLTEAGQIKIKAVNGHAVAAFYWNEFAEVYLMSHNGADLKIDVKEFENFLKTRPSPS